MESKIIVME